MFEIIFILGCIILVLGTYSYTVIYTAVQVIKTAIKDIEKGDIETARRSLQLWYDHWGWKGVPALNKDT